MNTIECPRESDVLTMVVTGQWPARVPDELRAHIAGCETCAELAVAAQAIDAEAEATRPLIRDLPSAGTIWWRAQLRARQEAVRDAVRPMTAVHTLGLAAIFAVAGAIFGASAQWFQTGLRSLAGSIRGVVASIEWPTIPLPTDASGLWTTSGTMLLIVGLGLVAAAAILGWAMKEDS
jgi:hypothetical protein